MPLAEQILAAAPLMLVFIAGIGVYLGAYLSGRLKIFCDSSSDKGRR